MSLYNLGQTLIGEGLPILGKLIAGENGEHIANKIAQYIGVKPDELGQSIKNPDIILRLKELENERLNILFNDVANARNRQIQLKDNFVDKLAMRIIKYNMINIFLLVLINALLILYAPKLKLPISVVAPISNLLGIVIGRYLEERSQITGYYFGNALKTTAKKIFGDKG